MSNFNRMSVATANKASLLPTPRCARARATRRQRPNASTGTRRGSPKGAAALSGNTVVTRPVGADSMLSRPLPNKLSKRAAFIPLLPAIQEPGFSAAFLTADPLMTSSP